MITRPCTLCDKQLEPALENLGWSNYQPNDGGELQFIFAYGSKKFDNHMGSTVFRGLICDDCAEKYVNKMLEMP